MKNCLLLLLATLAPIAAAHPGHRDDGPLHGMLHMFAGLEHLGLAPLLALLLITWYLLKNRG